MMNFNMSNFIPPRFAADYLLETSQQLDGFSIGITPKSRYKLTVDHAKHIRATGHELTRCQPVEKTKPIVKVQPL